jgi:acylphosphatase
VENRPDGSVYAELEGPAETVEEMIRWCRQGPPLAEVSSVEVREGQPERHQGFEVRR